VVVRAGRDARRTAGIAFSGSGAGGGRSPDVRGARSACHHIGGECGRHRAPHTDPAPNLGQSMTDTTAAATPRDADDAPVLTHSWSEGRAMRNGVPTIGAWVIALFAAIPLVSVLYMLIVHGGARLSLELFTELPPAGFEMGGGFGNAIIGTIIMVAIATVISVPIGVLAAAYLAELGPDSQRGRRSGFLAKVLTGLPSILAGVFVYAVIVLAMGTYSAIAGGVSLAILMLPTVVLTAEEAMKMVPRKMKDAALGMGCTRTQMIWKIVLP